MDYEAPTITLVEPSKIHTYGGVITITGRNFGKRSKASAYYGDTKLSVQSLDYSDTFAYLTIPEGDGQQQTLSFTVNGQSDYVITFTHTHLSSLSFSYSISTVYLCLLSMSFLI